MRNGELALDEETVVLRIEDRLLDVLARECAHSVQRVPEAERDDLGPIAVVTLQRIGFPLPPSRVNLQPHGCIEKTETGFAKESARSAAQAWCVLDARPVQPCDLRR